jgi:hypothetical protein
MDDTRLNNKTDDRCWQNSGSNPYRLFFSYYFLRDGADSLAKRSHGNQTLQVHKYQNSGTRMITTK